MTYQGIESVSCKYGAPMGRAGNLCDSETSERFHVRKLRLDSGGYDQGGAYWGHGASLYHATSESGSHEMFFRLESKQRRKVAQWLAEQGRVAYGTTLDRLTARYMVKIQFPNARFFGCIKVESRP